MKANYKEFIIKVCKLKDKAEIYDSDTVVNS